MPIHIYWGEDEFLIASAVKQLTSLLDPAWFVFNYSQYPTDSLERAMTDILTAPVSTESRLVHIPDSSLDVFQELESIIPFIPSTNTLLLTCTSKPDGRNKAVKLLLSQAQVKEFSLISPWNTDALMYQVQNIANQLGVKISRQASLLLVEAIGNNTRLTYNEIEKLKTYTDGSMIPQEAVIELVNNSSGNALKLASTILDGDIDTALQITENLLRCNEPPLKIVATLVTTFRTWLTVKVCTLENWQNDNEIATLAEIKNPKRLYFLRNEVANVSVERLRKALPLLLELELMLKSGANERLAIQTQLVQLCH